MEPVNGYSSRRDNVQFQSPSNLAPLNREPEQFMGVIKPESGPADHYAGNGTHPETRAPGLYARRGYRYIARMGEPGSIAAGAAPA